MSEPDQPTVVPQPITTDPITAILVAVTEIKGDVKSALLGLRRVDGTLLDHSRRIEGAEKDIVELKTRAHANDAHDNRAISAKAAAAAVASTIILLISVLITLWVHH